jgi:WD40 repeat protein
MLEMHSNETQHRASPVNAHVTLQHPAGVRVLDVAQGSTIAAAAGTIIRLWYADGSPHPNAFEAHHGWDVEALALSGCGRFLASAASHENRVLVWHRWSDKVLELSGAASCLACAPEDELLAVGGVDGSVTLWRLSEFWYPHAWGQRPQAQWHWPPVARCYAGGSTFSLPRRVTGLAFSPDSMSIAACGLDGTIQVRAGTTGELLCVYRGHNPDHTVEALAWSPNGKCLASAGGGTRKVHVWNASTGRVIYTSYISTQIVTSLAWASAGGLLACGTWEGAVEVLTSTSGQRISTYRGHGAMVKAIRPLPGGLFATGSLDGTVQIWDPRERLSR